MQVGIDTGVPAGAVPGAPAPDPGRRAGSGGGDTQASDPLGDLFAAFVAGWLPQGEGQTAASGRARRQHATGDEPGAPHRREATGDNDTAEAAVTDAVAPAWLGVPVPVPPAQAPADGPGGSPAPQGGSSIQSASADGSGGSDAAAAVREATAGGGVQAANRESQLPAATDGGQPFPNGAAGEDAAPEVHQQAGQTQPGDVANEARAATGAPIGAPPPDDRPAPAQAAEALRSSRQNAAMTPAGRALVRSLAALQQQAVAPVAAQDQATQAAATGDVRVPGSEPGPAKTGQSAPAAGAGAGAPQPSDGPPQPPTPPIGTEGNVPPAGARASGDPRAGADVDAADRKAPSPAPVPHVDPAARAGIAAPVATQAAALAIDTGTPALGLDTGAMRVDDGQDGDVVAQVVRSIRLQVRDGIGTARVQLRPEHLGEVQIDLTVARDRVTAVVHAERADVRAQIEQQGGALRSGLSAVGLHLEELTVRDETPRRDTSGGRQPQDAPGRRRRRTPDDKAFVLVA